MDEPKINKILQQLQVLKTFSSDTNKNFDTEEITKVDFSEKLRSAVDQVNNAQQTADRLNMQFVNGESDVDLHEVMISLQKANVSFQSMIQVRNKLVNAYHEIMNMQV